jgi:type IV pilus assembly protein PilX
MSILSKPSGAEFRCRPNPVAAGVTPTLKRCARPHAKKQRGVVLFFALIAMVIMMLAAVALIRSVDTSTMIAGNLAFKQAASSSGDGGVTNAIGWLAATQLAMQTAGKDVYKDADHAFNNTNAAAGYYANADPTLSLTTDAVWDAIDPTITYTDGAGNSRAIGFTDSAGNNTLFVIQRMCRIDYGANDTRNIPNTTNCLFSNAALDNSGKQIPLPQDVCQGSGCPSSGQTPQLRITARVQGPKNTVSYIQSFIY